MLGRTVPYDPRGAVVETFDLRSQYASTESSCFVADQLLEVGRAGLGAVDGEKLARLPREVGKRAANAFGQAETIGRQGVVFVRKCHRNASCHEIIAPQDSNIPRRELSRRS